ncbi:MAG: phosphoribosylaminoimidazolesuccinocarboxamide synthase [Candidatus Heimdallarchaeota archaeon]
MERINGKNKDGIIRDHTIEFVFSNRLSAFDRIVGETPGRGQVLADCTRIIYKFLSRNNVATALLDEGQGNTIIQRRCQPLDFEFIMRNLLTGSALKRAKLGELQLPIGMNPSEYALFPETFVEVSTKREAKDRYGLSEEEIKGIMVNSFSGLSAEKGFDLFKQALKKARKVADLLTNLFRKSDLFLIDGKVEFGVSDSGQLCLIDSFGPDEFRVAELTWANGPRDTDPDFLDKEFIRKYLEGIHESEYAEILLKYGPTLVSRYRTVTNRLKEASGLY